MKKYIIVLILGLFLGVCFARSAYGQDTKQYYYKQYTYPYYIESGDFFETKCLDIT